MLLYSEDINGVIMSWADRYPFTHQLYQEVIQEWDQYKNYLKVDPNYWAHASDGKLAKDKKKDRK